MNNRSIILSMTMFIKKRNVPIARCVGIVVEDVFSNIILMINHIARRFVYLLEILSGMLSVIRLIECGKIVMTAKLKSSQYFLKKNYNEINGHLIKPIKCFSTHCAVA